MCFDYLLKPEFLMVLQCPYSLLLARVECISLVCFILVDLLLPDIMTEELRLTLSSARVERGPHVSAQSNLAS